MRAVRRAAGHRVAAEQRKGHWRRRVKGRDKVGVLEEQERGRCGETEGWSRGEEKATKSERWAGLGGGVPYRP